jgi:hypothetical protein
MQALVPLRRAVRNASAVFQRVLAEPNADEESPESEVDD